MPQQRSYHHSRRPKKFRLNPFSKGLLLGLFFGLSLAAITVWLIGNQKLPQDKHTPPLNAKPSTTKKPSTLPRQFGFYNQPHSDSKKQDAQHQPTTPPLAMILTTQPYQKLSEVESIKARLAILGFEPKIQIIGGKFLLQLGPYTNMQAIKNIQQELGNDASLFTLK